MSVVPRKAIKFLNFAVTTEWLHHGQLTDELNGLEVSVDIPFAVISKIQSSLARDFDGCLTDGAPRLNFV